MTSDDTELRSILSKYKSILIIGISPKLLRPSHIVARYLICNGYVVIGVYPGQKKILGQPIYETLVEVPIPIEIVNVFRAPQYIEDLVQQLIPLRPKVLWLQEQITHPSAEVRAKQAGIQVISDLDIMKTHHRLIC